MTNSEFAQLKVGDKLKISPDFLKQKVGSETNFKVKKVDKSGLYIDNGSTSLRIDPHDRWFIEKPNG